MSNDIEELTALNRDYVASVQNCDVKRFDEILAQDFYCSNPDKSLVDRAAFLKQTAVPVTIKNLRAEDVKIRMLGDFAIIHAARAIRPRTDSRPTADIPIAGRSRTENGSRCRRTCRGSTVIVPAKRDPCRGIIEPSMMYEQLRMAAGMTTLTHQT